jgi:NADH:ubiquinone oxidoreductase subunit K
MNLPPVGLEHYLILAGILFGLGVYGVVTRRNAVGVLMSVELILNAVNLNFVAFNHFKHPAALAGQVFAIFVITLAAAEASVGMALVVSIFRSRRSVEIKEVNLLKW